MSVRRGIGDFPRPKYAAGPWLIDDGDRLAELFCQFLRDNAPYDVRAASRRKRHDQHHGLVWIIRLLRER